MRRGWITVALTMYWLVAGVVGAASLLPDDQYSPQQSPYERDAARGPRGYPNWLEYHHRDPSAESDPPENNPGSTFPTASDLSRDAKPRKDSSIPNSKLPSPISNNWDTVTTGTMRNFTGQPHPDLDVPDEGLEISSASSDEPYEADDNFQDQGPGSVEIYKLDLRRENSLLVPQSRRKQPTSSSWRTKSKIPKKAKSNDITWKSKSIVTIKTPVNELFQQPQIVYRGETIPPEFTDVVKDDRKNEATSFGGVPELQVGCEGLEATDRKKRSSGIDDADNNNDDDDDWPKFRDPVYRESTEPILLRVTPIVLDFEDEPPSGQIYEELDELLKLKSTTTTEPTTKRANRGDIDPALENYQREHTATDEKLPERGDLGPNSGKDNTNGDEESFGSAESRRIQSEGLRFPREADGSSLTPEFVDRDDGTSSTIIGPPSDNPNHRSGRKLLWVEYPESHEGQPRHRREVGNQREQDLWGFGENDGELPDDNDVNRADELRKLEEQKRRREYERRRHEQVRRTQSRERSSTTNATRVDDERIREEYERLQENEQRERRRLEEERRRIEVQRHREEHRRRTEEARRRQSEETRRNGNEAEDRSNGDPSYSRRREEEERRRQWDMRRRQEEEERRIRNEEERNNQAPPSALTRASPYNRSDNRSRSQQQEEEERRKDEERKLREYVERNRPSDVRRNDDRRRAEHEMAGRHEMEERRKQMEDQRRRQMEEQRRRDRPDDERAREQERRRRLEEQRRRDRPDDERAREQERRRRLEEQRRRDRPDDERAREQERRRRLEEERKLRDYVRRNQPINVPRRNSSQLARESEDQRRVIDEARRWEHHRQRQMARTNDVKSHGPSAPTDVGHRQTSENSEESLRRRERERLERVRFQDEGRRREQEYRRAESRRREEERRRLEAARKLEESNERRYNWQDGRRNASQSVNKSDDRAPGELRRVETSRVTSDGSRRNQDDDLRRRHEERERQRHHHEERERQRQLHEERERQRRVHEERERTRMDHETNARNNGRRRPQHEDTRPNEQRQRGVTVGIQEETDRRRREEARLNALPVRARIVVRSDRGSSRNDETSQTATLVPPTISIGPRNGFDNELDFPAINPNRPGLHASRFPAPATDRPPIEGPSACVWAIVNCCPANDRLATCFESMDCPAVNWDPSPCRPAVQAAARAQVLSFYATGEDDYGRA